MTSHEPASGILFVVAAPSGAGKTSLVHGLLDQVDDIALSVSHTTRPRRATEVNGQDYWFVDSARFQEMIAAEAFLEYAEVFGNCYGTSRHSVETALHQGKDVLLEIDWQGAQQVRHNFAEAVSIFILPPSRETLVQRLRQRGQDQPEVIDRRTRKAVEEMSHFGEFDYLVVNDDFNLALEEMACIVRAERLRQFRQRRHLQSLLSQLLQQEPS